MAFVLHFKDLTFVLLFFTRSNVLYSPTLISHFHKPLSISFQLYEEYTYPCFRSWATGSLIWVCHFRRKLKKRSLNELSTLLKHLWQWLQPWVFSGMTQHTCIWGVSPILLCRSFQALSGWIGSVAAQLCSCLSRVVSSGSSSGTFRDLSRNHSCVVLAVCLGSLSCWKVNLRPSLRSWVLWSRFSSRISWYIAPFIFS